MVKNNMCEKDNSNNNIDYSYVLHAGWQKVHYALSNKNVVYAQQAHNNFASKVATSLRDYNERLTGIQKAMEFLNQVCGVGCAGNSNDEKLRSCYHELRNIGEKLTKEQNALLEYANLVGIQS